MKSGNQHKMILHALKSETTKSENTGGGWYVYSGWCDCFTSEYNIVQETLLASE